MLLTAAICMCCHLLAPHLRWPKALPASSLLVMIHHPHNFHSPQSSLLHHLHPLSRHVQQHQFDPLPRHNMDQYPWS
jgi:hypothetical protein